MNPIVFALRYPIVVMVAMVGIVVGSVLAVSRMKIDIFPVLNLPVLYVAQPYGGMDPAQMEGLITNYYEYHFLYISGIHHVESKNVQGVALMKLYFHPGTDMSQAMAETVQYVNRSKAFMPPGTVAPFIMRFDTGSVPVGYVVLSSKTKSIAQIQDQALFKVRPMFASLPGVSAPPPFGGNARTIVLRIDPDRVLAYNTSLDEITAALTSGNTVSPSGNLYVGDQTVIVPGDSMIIRPRDLGSIPLRPGSTVFLRNLGLIEDAADIPYGYALVNDRRAVYLLATKRADASTLSVVKEIKANLPKMAAVLPEDIQVSFEFDQSPFVTGSMTNVVIEGVLGAVLTGIMVLIFLWDWRSVIVVVLNIPLALLGSLIGLWLTGQTINLMTLGGLALAVGILVDEATVEVENIHTQMDHAPNVARAVRLGNSETAVPRLLAMLCILAVFLPSFFMQGAAQALFVPLSLAVGFAMVTSYFLSSTFVPVMSVWLLRHHGNHDRQRLNAPAKSSPSPPGTPGGEGRGEGGSIPRENSQILQGSTPSPPTPLPRSTWGEGSHSLTVDSSEQRVNAHTTAEGRGFFASVQRFYAGIVGGLVSMRWLVIAGYVVGTAVVITLVLPWIGTEIFPVVDAGQFQLRLRAATGTNIKRTEELTKEALNIIGDKVGRDNVAISAGYIGLIPSSYPINNIFQFMSGPEEALVRIALKRESGIDTERLKKELRVELPEKLGAWLRGTMKKEGFTREQIEQRVAGLRLSFEPSDIVNQVMSFGAATPIEVAVSGPNYDVNRQFAATVHEELKKIDSLKDMQYVQPFDYPTIAVKVDRERAGASGIRSNDVFRSLVAATSSTRFVEPNFWRDPKSGIGYLVQVEVPIPRMKSAQDIGLVPLKNKQGKTLLLRDVANIRSGKMPGEYDRYNMRRMVSIMANIEDEDLGSVAGKIKQAIRSAGEPPRGVTVDVRGQIEPMELMFTGLLIGLVLAIGAIFLLLTAYFQSIRLALVVMSTAPTVVAGVAVALFVTGTTLNIQSFMGAIMAIGVATANAILLVTFAERARRQGATPIEAAIDGAQHRLRPILMTTCAMIAGMIPMALALGEGGQQVAPLGRAVIGGLIAATITTLLILPSIFAILQSGASRGSVSLDPDDPESKVYDGSRPAP